MSNLSKTTQDHDEIRKWAEERNGKPSYVKGTGGKDDPGLLRIDFPGYSGEGKLEEISWDEFFEKFDEQELALVYQEKTAEGQTSNFNKLVSRDTVEEKEHGGSHPKQAHSKATHSKAGSKSGHSKPAHSKSAAAKK
jgi:hypothetical protein